MLLTETQLDSKISQIYREEQIKILEEKWKTLTGSEKKFIFEFLKLVHPEKSYLLSEAKWYNTIGDIVGIFDPTGIVDMINSISYFKQGDNLFGVLSMISAFPIVGDLVGKTLMGTIKAGGKTTNILKSVKTAEDVASAAKQVPSFGKVLPYVESLGGKLLRLIERIPFGKRFTKVVRNWIEILTNGNKLVKTGKTMATTQKLTSKAFKGFRNFGIADTSIGALRMAWKRGGIFKNRELSKLLYKTKFWLGFLDFVGLGNFVGPPEDLERTMGQDEFNEKMESYMKTKEAEKNWASDVSEIPAEEIKQKPSEPSTDKTSTSADPFTGILSKLLGF